MKLVRRAGVMLLWAALMQAPHCGHTAEGNEVFMQKCGTCHRAGGEVAPISPAAKAGLVWVKYFQRKRHPVDLGPLVSDAEMALILKYLASHAADSEVPEAAVIPR